MKDLRIFVGDFETTVWENPILQPYTEVWASGIVELETEDCYIHTRLIDTFNFFIELMDIFHFRVYYHNLKFDGTFWIDFLMNTLHLKPALKKKKDADGNITYKMVTKSNMRDNTFICSISQMGQWYSITIKMRGHYLELRDSLKLIPVSVKCMGESYKTKHKKLEIEYVSNNRHAGGELTKQEREYLMNDLFVVKEVLEIMFHEGHKKLTIGSCCMSEFRQIIGRENFKDLFPYLPEIPCNLPIVPEEKELFPNWDAYIRRGYKGAWCYLKPEYAGKVQGRGITADINSLYPYVMSSDSGNAYPVGMPHEWQGDFIPDKIKNNPQRFYYLRFRCRFQLKEGKLPTVQIKDNWLYISNEWLTTSDILGDDGEYYDYYIDENGEEKKAFVTLTMTCIDFKLFLDHYNVIDLEILDGCWFYAEVGLFDEYIEKYKQIKETSEGAKREISKLYLNNLYGKFATSTDSSFKYPVLEDGKVVYKTQKEEEKTAGYIAIGAAITSYARYFTITHAQENFKHFVYADTDSIHCIGTHRDLKNIKVHPTTFGCWKLEATWDKAIFIRQKTYIEHVYEENLKPVKKMYYNIKCAGMPDRCKDLFNAGLTCKQNEYLWKRELGKLTKQEKEFLSKKNYTLEDFNLGLTVPSKLLPSIIKGGTVLKPTTYKMR